jgi:uncharacterized Rmd1/YagE family protein
MTSETNEAARRLTLHAMVVGDRIDAARFEPAEMIASTPLALRLGPLKLVALYRFGVVVFLGLTDAEKDEFLTRIAARISGKRDQMSDEIATIDVMPSYEDRIPPGGPIQLPDLSDARFLILADVLAKTVSLARHEHELGGVFDAIEPFAVELARTGHAPWNRRRTLKLIGQALLVQHRISGRVEVEEKPDILWDQPGLERLYARLEDEYELKERSVALTHKLNVIVETGQALSDIFDTDRSTRLEAIIVILILAELVIGLVQILSHRAS